ncbi:MAG: methyltransferase domain-containing protein [Magnetococcales bacterium]|nr:methyltransferase domain-containing protein [Magnetococcales bacterium]
MKGKPDAITPAAVRAANKTFYNLAAGVYEAVDGRRTQAVLDWIGGELATLRSRAPGDRLLDLGCGSGVVMRCARPHFRQVVGVDLAFEILRLARADGPVVCGDAGALPFMDNSLDVVVCFAALHHLFDHAPLVREVYRVLRPGGLFYSDHDLAAAFSTRFALPLGLYRRLHNAQRRYQKADDRLTQELYTLTEIHAAGMDHHALLALLRDAGFARIEHHGHWYGLNPLCNRLFGQRRFAVGWAPLLQVTATK